MMRIPVSSLVFMFAACVPASAQYVVASPQGLYQSAPGPLAGSPAYMAAPAEMIGPGCLGRLAGVVGRRLESYSWPRVRPAQAVYQAPPPALLYMVQSAPPSYVFQSAPPPQLHQYSAPPAMATPQQSQQYYGAPAPPSPPVSPQSPRP